MEPTTKTGTRDVTSDVSQGGNTVSEAQWRDWNRRRSKGNRNKWVTAERRWNEWEQRRNEAIPSTWDAATRQAEWYASAASAVNSTTYGKAIARILTVAAAGDTATEAGRTEVAKTPITVGPDDVTSNEWEQKRNKITLNTWDFRHAATTTQTKWYTSTAASSTGYGIVVEETSDTTGVKAQTMIEPTGVGENVSRHGPRAVPDNISPRHQR